jgi:hypothetical protein
MTLYERCPISTRGAIYVRANDEVEYETIAGLQEKLEKWAYAKKMQGQKAKKK